MASKENKGLEQWIEKNAEKQLEPETLESIWNLTESYKAGFQPDAEGTLSQFKQRLKTEIAPTKPKVVPMWRAYLKIAAAIVVLLFAAFLIKDQLSFGGNVETVIAQDGSKTKIGLEDGSVVVLNENSKLTFPEKFDRNERHVSLEGEGFFQVAKDSERPFTIKVRKAEVRVIGTSFNVRAYPEENYLEVYVQTGVVAVRLEQTKEEVRLTEGEKLIFHFNSGKKERSRDEDGNVAAWNTGKLRFKSVPMKEVFATIERLVGVKIEVADNALLDCPYTHSFELKQWRDVLKAMEKTCPIKVSESSSEKFVISGQCCEYQ